MNETKSQHMGTVGKSTKFQLIRNTAAITSCDKLSSIARIIKIISAVINRSIKLNLIINSTKFFLVSCRFSSNHSLSTRNEWMKRRITVWAGGGGWFPFGGVLITRRRCRSTRRQSKVRNVLMIIFHLRSASLHQQSSRYQKVMAFLQTQKRHEDDCWEWETCLRVKRGEKRSDLVVPYGDQVMLAQALQKTFPNVFFSSFLI